MKDNKDYKNYIFLSHSRRDKELTEFFEKAIKRIGLEVVLMEQEKMNWVNVKEVINVNQLITDGIRHGCVGLAVLLGKNVLSPQGGSRIHTQNWISFEIGVAAGSSKPGDKRENTKPIIVFEDYNDDINFPVPFLTDYIRYNRNDNHFKKIGDALNQILSGGQMFWSPDNTQCTNPNCGAMYRYWSENSFLPCPVCRIKFDYGEPITRYDPLRFLKDEV